MELHLDELGIQLAHQLVVDQHAIDLLELEIVIVEAELDARLLRLVADLVQLVGGAHPIGHGRVVRKAECPKDHLRQTHFLRPGDALVQTFTQPPKLKMGASVAQLESAGSYCQTSQCRTPTGLLLERHEQCRQHGVKGGRKRVGYGYSPPRKPLLEIFRQEQTTLGLRRRG